MQIRSRNHIESNSAIYIDPRLGLIFTSTKKEEKKEKKRMGNIRTKEQEGRTTEEHPDSKNKMKENTETLRGGGGER